MKKSDWSHGNTSRHYLPMGKMTLLLLFLPCTFWKDQRGLFQGIARCEGDKREGKGKGKGKGRGTSAWFDSPMLKYFIK